MFSCWKMHQIDFDKPGTIINEEIISRHDTCRIGEMFHLLKHNYRKLFDTTLSFRLIVIDLSWASIHCSLDLMNGETVEEYSHRIFNFPLNKLIETVSLRVRSFLSSCVSQTMIHKSTKKHVTFFYNECKTLAVCCSLF